MRVRDRVRVRVRVRVGVRVNEAADIALPVLKSFARDWRLTAVQRW